MTGTFSLCRRYLLTRKVQKIPLQNGVAGTLKIIRVIFNKVDELLMNNKRLKVSEIASVVGISSEQVHNNLQQQLNITNCPQYWYQEIHKT